MSDKIRENIREVLSEYFSFRKMEFHEMMLSQYENSDFEEFLLENMRKEKIDEGLIKSSPPNQAIYIFKRIVGDSNISFLKDRGVFFINILELGESDLGRLFNSFKQLGYFASEIVTIRNGDSDSDFTSQKYTEDNLKNILSKKEDFRLISLQVIGYYVNQIEDVPDFLYHITKKSLLEKINKQGLVPKSKSKKVYHPERIYLTLNPKKAMALKSEFEDYYGDDMVLLTISTEKVNGLKIYNDPDYSSFGVYTLDNIPPSAIVNVNDDI